MRQNPDERTKGAGARCAPAPFVTAKACGSFSAPVYKILGRHADVARDHTNESGRDVPTAMIRDRGAATIGMPELAVGAALAHLDEAQTF